MEKTEEKNAAQKKTDRVSYRSLRTQKEYLKMTAADVINRFGDSVDALAFTWMVYAITGSAAWSAIVFGLNRLPTIFIQPFAGAAVERMSKKKLMVWTDLLRGLLVTALAGLYGRQLAGPAVLVIFTLLISTVEAFRVPAGVAFLPKILDRDYYEVGTGLSSMLSTVTELVGTAAAGVILGIFGIKAAILVDAATFFLSAAIISGIHGKEEEKKRSGTEVAGYIDQIRSGIRYFAQKKTVLVFCVLAFLVNALLTPLNALQTPLVVEVLQQDSSFLSILGISLGLGLGAGSFLYPYLVRRLRPTLLVYRCGILLGICYLLYPLAGQISGITWAVVLIGSGAGAGMGVSCGILMSVLHVQFMKCVEEEYLARASAVMNAGACGAIPLVSAAVGGAASFCSVTFILVVCGILSVVLFICMALKKVSLEGEE